jgi:flagellar biosynthesis/type III secretory pathway protein FliH
MTRSLPFGPLLVAGSAVIVGAGRGRPTRRGGAPGTPFAFPPFEPIETASTGEAQGHDDSDEIVAPPPPEPTYGEAELAAAVSAARAEAAAEAAAAVRAELEADIALRQSRALAALARRLEASQAELDRALQARAGASRDAVLTLVRTLVPRALERQPLADLEAMLIDLVARLERQPRLELYLPPDLVASGEALLAEIAEGAGYRGDLAVHGDVGLGPGDARLEWVDGRAERDLAALEREALALVDAWLPPEDGRLDREAEAAPGGCTGDHDRGDHEA